jgi:DNA-binding CsgD family transcriptional regulator/PAS domain-containing protein
VLRDVAPSNPELAACEFLPLFLAAEIRTFSPEWVILWVERAYAETHAETQPLEAKLLDLIYGAVADPHRWADVLVGVSDHLGAMGGMLAYVPAPSSRKMPTQILGRLPEEASAVFRERHAWNPWTVAVAKYPFGKAVSANSLIEPGLIRKTEFYADVLAPWDQADILDINHKALAVDGSVGGFGFSLSTRAAAQAEERVRRLDLLTPHLCRAFEASLLLGASADGTRQLSVILELMPNAALLLDGRGRVTQANTAAQELLRQSDGIAFDGGGNLQLVSVLASERNALARALKDALDVAGGLGMSLASEPVRVSRPSGAAPLLVLAVPLPRRSFTFWELVAPARVLVVIVDPAAKSRAAAASLQVAYGLTAAEARVALLLASGITGSQMPAALGVTAATIKTHLRRCFEKTGTHSQAELSRLFTMFPPTGGGEI